MQRSRRLTLLLIGLLAIGCFVAASNNSTVLGNMLFKPQPDEEANDADVFNNSGHTLEKLGKLDEAVTAYRKAIQSNPNHVLQICQEPDLNR